MLCTAVAVASIHLSRGKKQFPIQRGEPFSMRCHRAILYMGRTSGEEQDYFFLSFQFLIKYIQITPSMVHCIDDVRAHVYLQVQEMASVHNYLQTTVRLLGSGARLST